MSAEDTIAAIASPPGAGARGAVRVSGPRAFALLERAFRPAGLAPEPGTRALLAGRLDDGRGTQPCLLAWMPGPRSYTREDVAELHLPGAPPLLARALERLLELGARAARPGEFTRRAFVNGRIDLTRAEGVLALVHARGEAERRAATALLLGGLEARVAALRDGLDELRALCEASLDFDESDTGHVPADELARMARAALAGLDEAARWEERRAPASGAPRVVLVGAPNAGKSSLFNALSGGSPAPSGGSPAGPAVGALVADEAGTTRDVLEADWELAGARARLCDTAGLEALAAERDAADPALADAAAAARGPAEEAQALAREALAGADLALFVADASAADPAGALERTRALPPGLPVVLAWNQVDRPGARPEPWPELVAALGRGARRVATAAPAGRGLDRLARACAEALGLAATGSGAVAGGAARELAARHRAALARGREELAAALDALAAGAPLDAFAEGLRGAGAALDDISGRTTSEDLLDRVFARFCIGK